VTLFEFRKDFRRQKTRVPGLSCGAIRMFLCLAILVEHRLVTDGQTHRRTDGQTDGHTTMVYTAQSIARAVKTGKYLAVTLRSYRQLVDCFTCLCFSRTVQLKCADLSPDNLRMIDRSCY